MMALSGCAGWGQDGSANENQDADENTTNTSNASNTSDDLENASQENTTGDENADADTDAANSQNSDSNSDLDATTDTDTSDGDDSTTDTSEPESEPANSGAADDSDDSNANDDSDSGDDGDTDSSDESDTDSDSDTETAEDQERPVHTLTVHAGPRPAADIPITIERHSDGATTTRKTSSDGSVEFSVYPDEYTVTGEDRRGNTAERTITVESDTEIRLGELLGDLPETHTLTVTVVDESGEPIEGASTGGVGGVLPSGADAVVSGTTDANGQARLEVYQGHTYLLDAQSPDHEMVVKEVLIDGDTEVTFTLPAADDSDAQASSTANESTAA